MPADAVDGPATAQAAPTTSVAVTLLTGDRVRVETDDTGRPLLKIEPSPRSGGIPTFSTRYVGDHVYVVPGDVAELVPGVLDEGLFDVTGLAAMGYDDSRSSIPLIVRYAPDVRQLELPSGFVSRTALPSIDGMAVDLSTAGAADFGGRLAAIQRSARVQRQPITPRLAGANLGGLAHIWLDRQLSAADLDGNLTQIGAPAAWQAGLTGAGTTVAVLDTGIDEGHPDLAGQVAESVDFTGTVPAGNTGNDDDNGHGTHVASLVAGTGVASAGSRRGVAFGARLQVGKVLDYRARGQASWIIAGMQWAVAQGSKVVNLSISDAGGRADDPVVLALESLTASGDALFVVAAGNYGPSGATIGSPGLAASALTVGAVTSADVVSGISSHGPTRDDYRLKPDITAPGVNIVGARAGGRGETAYATFTGTSQATPQVAGAAAILRAMHPTWGWQQIKSALVSSATPTAGTTVWAQGGGRLDLARATTATVTSDVSGVDFGAARWPNRAARTQTVTLTNSSTTSADVDLALATHSATGAGVPAGLFDVSPARLTLPAGGTATATVTFHPDLAPVGSYGGSLSVTRGSEVMLRLPMNGYVEPERYDLAVSVLDRNGAPYAGGRVDLVNVDDVNGASYFDVPLDGAGRATRRVSPGYYWVQSRVATPDPAGGVGSIAFAGDPELRVDRDTGLVVDARKALPVTPPAIPGVPTRMDYAQILTSRADQHQARYSDAIFPSAADVAAGAVLVQPSGRPLQHGSYQFTTRWRLLPTGPHRDGADLYDLVLPRGSVPTPPVLPLTTREVRNLARLDVDYYALGADAVTSEARFGGSDLTLSVGAYRPVALPSHRLELLSAGPGIRWSQEVKSPSAIAPMTFSEPDTTYSPGQRVRVHWFRTLQPQAQRAARYPTTQVFETELSDGEHIGQLETRDVSSAVLRVSRNGALLGEQSATGGAFTVPTGPGHYTVEQSLGLAPTATSIAADSHTIWTFDSTSSGPPQDLPTVPAVIRLDVLPQLDDKGYARSGRPLPLTVVATHLKGSTALPGGFRELRLWYSGDNGTSWLPIPSVRTGTGRYAALIPGRWLRGPGPVALRATAVDAAGATIDRTVHSAFLVRR